MTPPAKPIVRVILTGADAAGLAALQPAADILAGYGIAVVKAVAGEGEAGACDGIAAVIVASTDGALPSAVAAATTVPVIRVPLGNGARGGLDVLRAETGNLPAGPEEAGFATMAIGAAGAKNAALFVVAVLALTDERIRAEYAEFRARQTAEVLNHPPLEW